MRHPLIFVLCAALPLEAAAHWVPASAPQPTEGPKLDGRGDPPNQIVLAPPVTTAAQPEAFKKYIGKDGKWTAKGEDITRTFTNSEGSTTTEAVAVATSSDDDKDINILLSQKLASKFKDLVTAANTACTKNRRRAVPASACVRPNFINRVMREGEGVIRQADSVLAKNRPLISAGDISKIVATLKAGGAAVNAKLAAGAGVGALAIWFYELVEHARSANVPNAFAIPKPDDDKPSESGCPKDAPKGADAPVCEEGDCDGNAKGKVCTNGKYKGCKCNPLLNAIFDPADKKNLDLQQKILGDLENMQTKPETECSPNKNPYDNPINADVSFVKSLSESFCKTVNKDPKKEHSATLTNKDLSKRTLEQRTPPPSKKAYEGYKFEFKYTPGKQECGEKCEEAFKRLTAACMGVDSHVMQPKGTGTMECGAKYSYNINYPPGSAPEKPKVKAPDGTTFQDVQCISDKFSKSQTFTRDHAKEVIKEVCKKKPDRFSVYGQTASIKKDGVEVYAKVWYWWGEQDKDDGKCDQHVFKKKWGRYTLDEKYWEPCEWYLTNAMDQCETNTQREKRGGIIKSSSCMKWAILSFSDKDVWNGLKGDLSPGDIPLLVWAPGDGRIPKPGPGGDIH